MQQHQQQEHKIHGAWIDDGDVDTFEPINVMPIDEQFCDCLMRECVCWLAEDEVWFTGMCTECGVEIADVKDAYRIPWVEGGWSGCLCSWTCVAKTMDDTPMQHQVLEAVKSSCDAAAMECDSDADTVEDEVLVVE